MSGDALESRGRALEGAFFRERDARAIAALGDEREHAEALAALARLCGVQNQALLEPLVAQGLRAETVAALFLVPLIAVAWSDGLVQDAEREEIEASAAEFGIAEGSACADLFHGWLRERPDERLFQAWVECARAIAAELEEDQRWVLEDEMLGRARRIASAARGPLGVGARVSRAERHTLEILADAFEKV